MAVRRRARRARRADAPRARRRHRGGAPDLPRRHHPGRHRSARGRRRDRPRPFLDELHEPAPPPTERTRVTPETDGDTERPAARGRARSTLDAELGPAGDVRGIDRRDRRAAHRRGRARGSERHAARHPLRRAGRGRRPAGAAPARPRRPTSPTRRRSSSTRSRRGASSAPASDHVPAYIVLSDAHLEGIADREPESLADLARCAGIGPTKLERYGDEIVAVDRRRGPRRSPAMRRGFATAAATRSSVVSMPARLWLARSLTPLTGPPSMRTRRRAGRSTSRSPGNRPRRRRRSGTPSGRRRRARP